MSTVNLFKNARSWFVALGLVACLAVPALTTPYFAEDATNAASEVPAVAGEPEPGFGI